MMHQAEPGNTRVPPGILSRQGLGGLLCMMFCLLPGIGKAQPQTRDLLALSFEELLNINIFSTPKFSSDPKMIPTSVDILTAEDFRTYGWQTMGDALRSLQGFVVTNDYSYIYAGARGLSAAGDYRPRMQVLINGNQINENIYDSVNLDHAFPLDISQIERVEVIRGPSASTYGSNSMFGIINVVTRTGETIDGPELIIGYGSGKAEKAVLNWGTRTANGDDIALSMSMMDVNGRRNYFPEYAAEGYDYWADHIDGEHGFKLSGIYGNGPLHGSVIYQSRTKNDATGSWGTILNDPANKEQDALAVAELSHTASISDNLSWINRVFYGHYRYHGYFSYDYSGYDPDYVINFDFAEGRWRGLESRLEYRPNARHTLIAGFIYNSNYRMEQVNFDLGYGCVDNEQEDPCLNDLYRNEQGALYVQDDFQLGANTTLIAGLRYDRPNDQKNHFSPRLGLIQNMPGFGTFKYLYAEAFRNPNVSERRYDPVPWGLANPDALPEYQKSHEFTLEKSLARFGELSASIYRFNIANFISTDEDGVVNNLPEIISKGLELEYRRQWSGGQVLRAGYAWQDSGFEHGARLENVSKHTLKFNLAYPLPVRGWTSGLEWQIASKRQTIVADHPISGYGVVNLNLNYLSAPGNFEFSLNIKDLFDREYEDPVGNSIWTVIPRDRIRQLGRTLQATMVWRL